MLDISHDREEIQLLMRKKKEIIYHFAFLKIVKGFEKQLTSGLLFSGMFNKWVGGGFNLIGRGGVIKDGLARAVD